MQLALKIAALALMVTAGSGPIIAQTHEIQPKAFDSPDQARDLAVELSADAARRGAIAVRGRARALRDHTFVARMHTLLQELH